jgi:HK97 gp10 family phage protein
VIADEAKRNAEALPVSDTDDRDDYIRTGKLARSISIRRDPNPRDVTERAVIKPSRKAWYWLFIEFGTEKMPARPFLRPAFEARKEEALRVFQTALGKAIKRAARKAARLGLRRG